MSDTEKTEQTEPTAAPPAVEASTAKASAVPAQESAPTEPAVDVETPTPVAASSDSVAPVATEAPPVTDSAPAISEASASVTAAKASTSTRAPGGAGPGGYPGQRSREPYDRMPRDDRDPRERGPRSRQGGRPYFRKKFCKFCARTTTIDYKDVETLRRFVTERGKILPSRVTGNCAKHQRKLAVAIKRARSVALIPYSTH